MGRVGRPETPCGFPATDGSGTEIPRDRDVTAEAAGGPGSRPSPDVVWDEAGTFIILADIDLPSTVVGCQKGIAERLLRSPGLEAVRVDGGALVVA